MVIPAHARTTHKDLQEKKKLEEDLCWIVPHVSLMTQLVKDMNWTGVQQYMCLEMDRRWVCNFDHMALCDRCLLDVYLEQREVEGLPEEDKKEAEKEKEGKEEGETGMVSPMTTKILSLVSYLLSQPGIKSAILQLISAG